MARWTSAFLTVVLGLGFGIGTIGCGSDKPADKSGKMNSDKMSGDKMGGDKMARDKGKMGAHKMSKEPYMHERIG